jgi:hypothetical protein
MKHLPRAALVMMVWALAAAAGCRSARVQSNPAAAPAAAPRPAAAPGPANGGGLRALGAAVGDAIRASDFLATLEGDAVFAPLPIENRTGRPLDTRPLAEGLKDALGQSGRVKFAEPCAVETFVQDPAVRESLSVPEARAAVAKQAGANHALSALIEDAQADLAEPAAHAGAHGPLLALTVEITDAVSALVVWSETRTYAAP